MYRRIGGSAPCFCGSGGKFKDCHGRQAATPFRLAPDERHNPDLEEVGRVVQATPHPHGRPLPSTVHNGQRFRILGRRVYTTPLRQTFDEFLIDLVKWTFGDGWYERQLALSTEQQHQLVHWFDRASQRSRRIVGDDRFLENGRYAAPPTGDEQAIVTLGYDLFHVICRTELPKRLIQRLRNRDDFQSARYELAAAGILARAGAAITFLYEKHRRHCEFMAVDDVTGAQVGIEAKSRRRAGVLHEPGVIDESRALRGDIDNLLNEALEQRPDNTSFIVFVDVNVPPIPLIPVEERVWARDVWQSMQALRAPGDASDTRDVFNAIFVTSFPFHWQGANPATGTEKLSMVSGRPQFPLPVNFLARIIRAVDGYGLIPREI